MKAAVAALRDVFIEEARDAAQHNYYAKDAKNDAEPKSARRTRIQRR
jgi:hypothetical protein